MEAKSIVISLRFNGSLNQESTILFFIELFKKHHNKLFSELHYTTTDKTKSYWKQKTRGGKYTENSFNKFKEVLKQSNEKIFIDFELLTNLKDYEYKSRDIDISIAYSQTEEIKSLNFVFNSSWGKDINFRDFSQSLCNLLTNQGCKILYGFVFELENSKMPAFYIQGVKAEQLNKQEEEKILAWSNNKHQCDDKIWDIFWGNIISSNHIVNANTVNDIERIVDKENVRSLTPNLIWFNLNEPLTGFDILKYSSQRKELSNYFKSIIMR